MKGAFALAQSTVSDNRCLQNTHPTGDYLTVNEFAREFGISVQVVYGHLRQGNIPHARIGGNIRIHRAALEAWLLSQQLTSTERSI